MEPHTLTNEEAIAKIDELLEYLGTQENEEYFLDIEDCILIKSALEEYKEFK